MATIAIGIGKGGGYTADVPINSLQEDGVPPEEGDQVSFSVEATVKSVSGGTATLDIDSVNGEPVSEEGAESPQEEQGEEEQEGAGGGPGPGGTSSQADGTGRPIGAAPARPLGRMMNSRGGKAPLLPTGETLPQMGARLRKQARSAPPLPF
jgi:hypothetical protein